MVIVSNIFLHLTLFLNHAKKRFAEFLIPHHRTGKHQEQVGWKIRQDPGYCFKQSHVGTKGIFGIWFFQLLRMIQPNDFPVTEHRLGFTVH